MKYPILHVVSNIIEEETVDSTITDELAKWKKEHYKFCIVQVPTLSVWRDHEQHTGTLAGYGENWLPPSFSDPTGEVKGTFVLNDRHLMWHRRGPSLNDHYERSVFTFAQDYFFTTIGLKTVLGEFEAKGYKFFTTDEPLIISQSTGYLRSVKPKKTTLKDILSSSTNGDRA